VASRERARRPTRTFRYFAGALSSPQISGVSWRWVSREHVTETSEALCYEARLSGAASAVLDDAVLDVGDAGRLDRADLLDLEVADVLEQPLAVPEQDRDEV